MFEYLPGPHTQLEAELDPTDTVMKPSVQRVQDGFDEVVL